MTGFDHPLLDFTEGRFACTEARGTTVFLSEALADFLISARTAGLTPVVISRPDAWWTFAARYHLDLYQGLSIVRDGDDFIDPQRGVRSRSVTALIDETDVSDVSAPVHQAELLQAVFSVSVHHSATEGLRLGEIVQTVGQELAGCLPAAWGAHEPATLAWDVDAFTEHIRAQMPEARSFVTGGGGVLQGVHRAERTRAGVLETFTGIAPIAALTASTESIAARAVRVLTAVADAHSMPAFGSITVLPGWRDGRVPVGPQRPAVPVAMLVGPRAVRALAADIADLAEQFDVSAAGRRRIPSMIAAFSDPDVPPWRQASDLARAFRPEAIDRALYPNGGDR